MKKLLCLVVLLSLTGCCSYQKSYNTDNGMDKAKAEKQYKKCLAGELYMTIKFWLGLQSL